MIVRPSRTTQPYRKGPRPPSSALGAMLAGRTATGFNPQDAMRVAQRQQRKRKNGMLAQALAARR